MRKHTILVKGVFNGLYFWGEGWRDNSVAIKWREFWKNNKSYIWKYVRLNDSDYLVSVTNSIFLHPMDFTALLTECGCLCNGSYFNDDIERLYKLCSECAEYCGGSFKMLVSEEQCSDYNLQEYSPKN